MVELQSDLAHITAHIKPTWDEKSEIKNALVFLCNPSPSFALAALTRVALTLSLHASTLLTGQSNYQLYFEPLLNGSTNSPFLCPKSVSTVAPLDCPPHLLDDAL